MIGRGAIIVLLASATLNSGCASEPAVKVRAVGVLARGAASGDAVALGHAALAIGNVGLALQQFRQSLRVDAASVAALSGIALCYDAMGRADLSRRYYEEALALAPADVQLLREYAASLARHGAAAEAQAVINEIAVRSEAPAVQWVIEPIGADVAAIAVKAIAAPASTAPAAPHVATNALTVRQAFPRSAMSKARLERVSLGEIALVTNGNPLWIALPTPTPARSVRLLNAARRQGLAARHRKQLNGTGWGTIEIGDAPHVRQSSLVLYPAGQRKDARRLADSLRIAAMRLEVRSDIVILLGRDRG